MKRDPSQAKLVVLYGRDSGRVIKLDDAPVTMGRAASNRIVIANMFVSRQHARIVQRAGGYWLEPLGNHNGTFVNAQRICKPMQLKDRYIIRVAHLPVLRFECVRW